MSSGLADEFSEEPYYDEHVKRRKTGVPPVKKAHKLPHEVVLSVDDAQQQHHLLRQDGEPLLGPPRPHEAMLPTERLLVWEPLFPPVP